MIENDRADLPGIELSRRSVLGSALALTAAGTAGVAAGPVEATRSGRNDGFVVVSGWVLTRADLDRLDPGRAP